MTHRHDLEHHRHSLAEIREIMNAMKTLAFMETRKLGHYLDAQQAVLRNIEDMAADLLDFHPDALPETSAGTPVYLLIGTERGFCGNFNHALVEYLDRITPPEAADRPRLIAVGRKLHGVLEGDARVAARIDGAGVAEELPALLDRLSGALAGLQDSFGVMTVECIHHGSDQGVVMRRLLPPFGQRRRQRARFPFPPVLHTPPRGFLVELAEHYLFAALNEVLYTSLRMENQRRVAHLEGAVKHLDDESSQLVQQCKSLRQEEIIEEIEVILLSAGSLAEP